MGVFAFCAAVVAFLRLVDVLGTDWLVWWLMFIALHFAFGWALPFLQVPIVRWRNKENR